MERIQVRDLDHLKEICSQNMGEPYDFVLLLNGGARSSKVLSYNPEAEFPNKDWYLCNMIDESEADLSDEQLMQDTNIGIGIERGAFFYEKYD